MSTRTRSETPFEHEHEHEHEEEEEYCFIADERENAVNSRLLKREAGAISEKSSFFHYKLSKFKYCRIQS